MAAERNARDGTRWGGLDAVDDFVHAGELLPALQPGAQAVVDACDAHPASRLAIASLRRPGSASSDHLRAGRRAASASRGRPGVRRSGHGYARSLAATSCGYRLRREATGRRQKDLAAARAKVRWA